MEGILNVIRPAVLGKYAVGIKTSDGELVDDLQAENAGFGDSRGFTETNIRVMVNVSLNLAFGFGCRGGNLEC
jgi:hypothetical protein